jgi:hypothetical protein
MTPQRWTFSVRQSGLTVASGDAPTEEQARREALHYGAMYAQDGPKVVVRVRQSGRRA